MEQNYLYIAQSTSSTDKRYNIYKMGCSTTPEERVRTLGGSCSTSTYVPLLILPLPMGLKDVHILSHEMLEPYVLYRNTKLQNRFLKIFGQDHKDGLDRRREILMFGTSFSKKKVIELVKSLVKKMTRRSKDGSIQYRCSTKDCVSSGGTEYCNVCQKYVRSLLNSLTYQKIQMNRLALGKRMSKKRRILELESIESSFTENISKKRKRRETNPEWEGPERGEYWVRSGDGGYTMDVVRVMTLDGVKRSSRVQWWSPIRNMSGRNIDSVFEQDTRDGTRYDTLDLVKWDDGGWIMAVKMVKSRRKGHMKIGTPYRKDLERFIKRPYHVYSHA
ncbi:hypothetical protein N9C24_04885 [Gammaproteobacteria bacterium]|nr:hypothetical protein [Gammaproteobacteria bacterium]